MNYTISWYIEKRVVFVEYGTAIILEDLLTINDTLNQLLEDGIAPVHIIYDVVALEDFPIQLKRTKEILSHLQNRNLGYHVGYGLSPIMGFMTQQVARVFGIQTRSVSSLDDAIQLLMDKDETLGKNTSVTK